MINRIIDICGRQKRYWHAYNGSFMSFMAVFFRAAINQVAIIIYNKVSFFKHKQSDFRLNVNESYSLRSLSPKARQIYKDLKSALEQYKNKSH